MDDIELILGTAQFSGKYGLTNPRYSYSTEDIRHILTYAVDNGIVRIDTAHSYPNVHNLLNASLSINLFSELSIATKLDFRNKHFQELVDTVLDCLQLFRFSNVDVIFVHDWESLSQKDFEMIKDICQFFPKIRFGASIYEVESVERVIEMRPYVTVVQLPINILNQSFVPSLPVLRSAGLDIWIRSAFLQGAIDWTSPRNKFRNHEAVRKLSELGMRIGVSPFALALDFLKGISSHLIVGVASKDQLNELFISVRQPKLQVDYIDFASFDTSLIDPRLW